METEKVLFGSSGDAGIYFGPNVDEITFLKYKHIFNYKYPKVAIKKSERKRR
jgi:hypothetical protein